MHIFNSFRQRHIASPFKRLTTSAQWLALCGAMLACGSGSKPKQEASQAPLPAPYLMDQPSAVYALPKELREVSGLGWYSKGRLACVQDELGKVYIFDLKKERVVDEVKFGDKGDYEGIERVANEVFVLRSDGLLNTYDIEEPKMRTFDPGLPPGTEVEGLGYDSRTNRLWIAVKEMKKTKEQPAAVVAYSFDLKTKTIWKGIVIPQAALNDFEATLGRRPAEFKPSGVAVHPRTGEVYLLASVGRRILVLNRNGQLVHSLALKLPQLEQPEGICFDPQGALYVASESRDKKGKGYILKFDEN